MTKLLWHSNAPFVPTGYGQQTGLFAPYLAEKYEVAISSYYGLEGAPIRWEGIPIMPALGGTFGGEVLIDHAARFFGGDPRGGIVMTLMDVWVLDPRMGRELNLACWVPVDHEPPPPKVSEFLITSGAVPIAMSRFGERQLGRLDPLYVPHAVDTEKYKPYDRKSVRKLVGVPDDVFLVGMVAANKGRPSRKGFVQAFQAFSKFAAQHSNAHLYLHTVMDPAIGNGEDLEMLLEAFGVPTDRVLQSDQYRMVVDPFGHQSMAKIYSSMDVLLNPSLGEGFGIPVLEAQACGLPVIVTDNTAMSEVCGDGAGWRVKNQPCWTYQNSWQGLPDIDDIASALAECHAMTPAERERMGSAARTHALGYDVRRVFEEFMLPALKIVEERFEKRRPVRIPSRLEQVAA